MKQARVVKDLLRRGYKVDHQIPKQLDRPIFFVGAGWYSLDEDGTYRYGQFATFSRIKISV